MKKLFYLIAPVVFIGLMVGCGGEKRPNPKTTTVDFSQLQSSATPSDEPLGDGLRIKFITSDEKMGFFEDPPRYYKRVQKDVQQQLEAFINSGRYEIVQVSTTRSNHRDAYLLSAEVYYRQK